MKKHIYLISLFLICSNAMAESGYSTFCGRLASTQISALNTPEQQQSLNQIEKLKDKYNKDLADETITTGVARLTDKFNKENDISSALVLEMITEMVKKPTTQSENFTQFCSPSRSHSSFGKVGLCQLVISKPEAAQSVEATFNNFKNACSYTSCKDNNDINKIDTALIEKVIKEKGEIKLTPNIVAGLKQKQKSASTESENRKRIRAEMTELQNPKFKDTENLKRYIGEKYIRTCSLQTPVSEINSSCGAAGVPAIMSIEIAEQNFKILGALSSKEGYKSTFSKAEIKSYKEICDRNQEDKNFWDTCRIIYSEFTATQDVMEPKDWEEVHKHSYVVNDPTTKEGYRIIPKASNTSIILKSIAPEIANFSNFWMWNIQQQAQIDILGQQAILERQYSYGYFNAYNNYNYGYFSANYMPTYNGVPSLSVSTGFNFGP